MYHHVRSVLFLYTPFVLLSEPLHPLHSSRPAPSHPQPPKSFFSLWPLCCSSMLGCSRGRCRSCARPWAPRARRLPPLSCLAMDEKRRQICLWFKVHPGNYRDWLKSWPTQAAMYNTTTPTQFHNSTFRAELSPTDPDKRWLSPQWLRAGAMKPAAIVLWPEFIRGRGDMQLIYSLSLSPQTGAMTENS